MNSVALMDLTTGVVKPVQSQSDVAPAADVTPEVSMTGSPEPADTSQATIVPEQEMVTTIEQVNSPSQTQDESETAPPSQLGMSPDISHSAADKAEVEPRRPAKATTVASSSLGSHDGPGHIPAFAPLHIAPRPRVSRDWSPENTPYEAKHPVTLTLFNLLPAARDLKGTHVIGILKRLGEVQYETKAADGELVRKTVDKTRFSVMTGDLHRYVPQTTAILRLETRGEDDEDDVGQVRAIKTAIEKLAVVEDAKYRVRWSGCFHRDRLTVLQFRIRPIDHEVAPDDFEAIRDLLEPLFTACGAEIGNIWNIQRGSKKWGKEGCITGNVECSDPDACERIVKSTQNVEVASMSDEDNAQTVHMEVRISHFRDYLPPRSSTTLCSPIEHAALSLDKLKADCDSLITEYTAKCPERPPAWADGCRRSYCGRYFLFEALTQHFASWLTINAFSNGHYPAFVFHHNNELKNFKAAEIEARRARLAQKYHPGLDAVTGTDASLAKSASRSDLADPVRGSSRQMRHKRSAPQLAVSSSDQMFESIEALNRKLSRIESLVASMISVSDRMQVMTEMRTSNNNLRFREGPARHSQAEALSNSPREDSESCPDADHGEIAAAVSEPVTTTTHAGSGSNKRVREGSPDTQCQVAKKLREEAESPDHSVAPEVEEDDE